MATFIVQRLACYARPVEVQKAVKETFRIDVALPQIMYYDPTTSGTDVAKKWRKLFEKTRDAFLRSAQHVPIAQKVVRLERMQRIADKAEDMRNYPLAMNAIVEAEKMTGNYYTNRHVIEDADPAAALAKMLGLSREDVLGAVGAAE